jgi:integrase
MASIKRRADGQWRARFRDVDGKERAHHAATRAAAQAWLDQQTAKIVMGTYTDPREGKITVAAYAAEWQSRRTWQPATHDRIARELRLYILPTFGSRPLNSLRRPHIEEWAKELPLSASSTRMVYETFSALLAAATDDERIPRNPAKGARLPAVERAPFVPLTDEETWALADNIAEHLRAGVIVAAGTGLRQGELFGLTRDRIDFLRRELRIDQQLWTPPRGKPVLKAPKTRNSYRTIALPRVVVDAIAAHVASYDTGEHDLVFHTAGRPVGRATASQALGRAAKAVGLTGRTWHDLRHYHASTLLSRGVSPALVAERLGHDVKTLLATYAHVIRADDDRVRGIVDETLGKDSADFSRTETG